ncbi:MAG TPA: shikimate kinase, partial [Gaiellaceae bacterium]|nr:shikimate kinase [Gaiellaceae bacterium]
MAVVTHALGRHVALVGFMGAGKTTLAGKLGDALARPVVNVDEEIEARLETTIPELFAARGEAAFRAVEAGMLGELLERRHPLVVDTGGGAAAFPDNRALFEQEAFTLLVDVDVETAWTRCRTTDRPLAQDESAFRALYARREDAYRSVAAATVGSDDLDGAVLAAAGIHYELGALDRLGELVPGDGPVALVADSTVMGIHGPRAQEALGDRLASTHELPAGEAAKQLAVVERLWGELRL